LFVLGTLQVYLQAVKVPPFSLREKYRVHVNRYGSSQRPPCNSRHHSIATFH